MNAKRRAEIARTQILPTLIVNLGMLGFGMMLGYSAPALPVLRRDGLITERSEAGWFASVLALGASAGCIIAGPMLDAWGRKATIMFAAAPVLFGTSLLVLFEHMLYLGRFIGGIGAGIGMVAVQVYVTEIALAPIRGLLSAFAMVTMAIGIVLVYALGLFLSWQMLAAAAVIPYLWCSFLTFIIPESPCWLRGVEQHKLSIVAITDLISGDAAVVDDEIEQHSEVATTWREFFREIRKPACYRAITVGVSLISLQQLQGINVITFYSVDLLLSAELKDLGLLSAIVVAAFRVLSGFGACLCIDRWGRRWLLLVTSFINALCCLAIGLIYCYFSMKNFHDKTHQTNLERGLKVSLLALLLIYIVNFSAGWAPVPRLVAAEIYPLSVRARMNGVSNCLNWLTAFIVTKLYWWLRENGVQNYAVFWLFSAASVFSLIVVWRYQPETKGLTLDEIQIMLASQPLSLITRGGSRTTCDDNE